MDSDSLEQQANPLKRWHVAAVLLIALLIRGGALIVWYDNLEADPDAYRAFAETLVETGVYGRTSMFYCGISSQGVVVPSAYRPPLYPLVLSHCVTSRFGLQLAIALTHLALGLATVIMTLILGRQLGLGRWSALAALLVAADPILLHHSTLVMTETLATFLATVVLYSLNRFSARSCAWNAGLAGGALALAALCRPVFLVTMALVACFVFFGRQSRDQNILKSKRAQLTRWKRSLPRVLNITSYSMIALAVLSPWVIRNWTVLERPVVATTHGGYTFELANNESFYSYLCYAPSGSTWDSSHRICYESNGSALGNPSYIRGLADVGPGYVFATNALEEILWDEFHYELGISAVRNDPAMFAYACLIRNGRLWQLVPHRLRETEIDELQTIYPIQPDKPEPVARKSMRYAVGLWYAGVFALAAIGCWTLWRARRTRRKKQRGDKEDQENESETAKHNVGPRPPAPWIWGFLMIASFMLVHTFYWTNMRMRAPLMPFVALLAAFGMACLCERRARRKASPTI